MSRGRPGSPARPVWRRASATLVLASLLSGVPFAEAQPKKDKPTDKSAPAGPKPPDRKACIQSFEDAQTSRKSGKLADAADHLTTCSHEKCPEITRRPCAQWKVEWANAMPKLTIEIVDASGTALSGARIIVDGQPEGSSTPGPLRVDPGSHTIVAAIDGRGEQRATVQLSEGGAGTARLVFPALAPPPPTASAPPPEPPKPSRWATAPKATYVVGAIGVVGMATFMIAGLSGRSDQSDLKTQCAPRCNPDDKDDAARKFLIADVGLAVGVVSLSIASYLLLRKPSPASDPAATSARLRFDVQTERTGATGLLTGSF